MRLILTFRLIIIHSLFLSPLLQATAFTAPSNTQICSQKKMQRILATATEQDWQEIVNCQPTFHSEHIITQRLIFEGAIASNMLIDCKGALFLGGVGSLLQGKDIIEIRSKANNKQTLKPEPIEHFTLKNCRIQGSIRIYGLGKNAQATLVKQSSLLNKQHATRAQQAAPRYIRLQHLDILSDYRIPVYFGPGVQHSQLSHSSIRGQSISSLVYLDAESGYNQINNNHFIAHSTKREIIAIDGSEHNRIQSNRFDRLDFGGIFIYRNCGEGASIRLTKPQFNKINDNQFFRSDNDKKPVIMIGAREGWRWYCRDDSGKNYGSSQSNKDFAHFNQVTDNQFIPDQQQAIKVSRHSHSTQINQ